MCCKYLEFERGAAREGGARQEETMLFSTSMYETAQAKWDALLARAGEVRAAELRDQMAQAEKTYSQDAVLAAKWICRSEERRVGKECRL